MISHSDKNYENELSSLKESIMRMGSLVETMISKAILALSNRDSQLAQEVISKDDQVDQLEMEIDTLCVKLLALHQPAASDLRFVTIGFKISTDLERMGDLAKNVCRLSLEIKENDKIRPFDQIALMASKSQEMVKLALDAFISRNTKRIDEICKEDDRVDELNDKVFDETIEVMRGNSELISDAVRYLMISRHLERIADHATNIAEEVKYIVEGEDIRHQ